MAAAEKTYFRVVYSDVRCSGLPAKDVGGRADPVVRFEWDVDYKVVRTPVARATLDPAWPEWRVGFLYDTRYAERLSRKRLIVTVADHDRVGLGDHIGRAEVDLFTLATGPSMQSLLLRDGAAARGRWVCGRRLTGG